MLRYILCDAAMMGSTASDDSPAAAAAAVPPSPPTVDDGMGDLTQAFDGLKFAGKNMAHAKLFYSKAIEITMKHGINDSAHECHKLYTNR